MDNDKKANEQNDISFKTFSFTDRESNVTLTLASKQNDLELLDHLIAFLQSVNKHGGYKPKQEFKMLLNEIECECFEDRSGTNKANKTKSNRDKSKLIESLKEFNGYLSEKQIPLSEDAFNKLKETLQKNHKPNDQKKFQEEKTLSVPIAAHETADWNERKAVKLVKQAAMHYYDGVLNSVKAVGFEALSNTPTWYMLFAQPYNPNILNSSAAGAALTGSIAVETGLTLSKFNKVLKHIEEFEKNRQDPDLKSQALTILEKRVHEAGLLYEGIDNYNLANYPVQKINTIISAKKLLTQKGELKNRIEKTALYLRHNPDKAVIKTAKTFAKAVTGLTTATLNTTHTAATGLLSILKPEHTKNIAQGFWTAAKFPFHFNPIKLRPIKKVEQKAYYGDIQKNKIDKSNPIHEHTPDEFIQEVKETGKALKSNIIQQEFEIAKLGTEGYFYANHVKNMIEMQGHFNPEDLVNLSPTPQNLSFAVSTFSLLAAWEPFSHMGHKVTEPFNVGTSARSKEAQQYVKFEKFYDEMIKAREEQEENNNENTPI